MTLHPTKEQYDITKKDYKTEQGINKVADKMFQHFFPASAFEKKKKAILKSAKISIQALGFDPMTEFPDVFPITKPMELPPLRYINHKINIIDEEVHWRMKP